MSRDTFTAIRESQEHFRTSAKAMCDLGGVPAPETERDWLKFSLNQGLRMRGIGKPLPWNPTSVSPWPAPTKAAGLHVNWGTALPDPE